MRLYELTGAYLQVFEQLDDEEANLDTLEDTLQCIEGEIEVKAESIGKLIKMLEFDADRIDDEMKRLQKMKDDLKKKRDARENRISRVKAYLRDQMDIIGKQKIKTPLMTLWLQDSESVDDFAPNLIPASYQKIYYSVDRAAILADLKAGKQVPGCTIKTSRGLRMR